MTEHPDNETLEAGLANIINSPADQGRLEMIVVRPHPKQRETPDQILLTRKDGVDGDHWSKKCWKSLEDGSPDPTVQVAIMNSRCLDLISGDQARWPLAGDNLIVDMDLSTKNLVPGQKLSLGEALLEVTAVPHTGCKSFSERFGVESLKFISTRQGKELRLRGVYAIIVRDGVVRKGDTLRKVG